jgi:hypothetical protein
MSCARGRSSVRINTRGIHTYTWRGALMAASSSQRMHNELHAPREMRKRRERMRLISNQLL